MIIHIKKEVYLSVDNEEIAKRLLATFSEAEAELNRADCSTISMVPIEQTAVPESATIEVKKTYLG